MVGRAHTTGIVGPTMTPRPIASKQGETGSAKLYVAILLGWSLSNRDRRAVDTPTGPPDP
ncbi:hypothetical protein SAMN05444166_3725 [Singulisphaera sp. GP187]|nr:hypothetical protein SAMN05444166_3725 [Singulisphaera sp. GP187]